MNMLIKTVLFLLISMDVFASEPQPGPNVIFIFVDDQGYYDLGCYGATEVATPRIDALAENGIRFTDYYAAAPICSPSRAGLLTGCYPRRTECSSCSTSYYKLYVEFTDALTTFILVKNWLRQIFFGDSNIFTTINISNATFINGLFNRFFYLAFVSSNKTLTINGAFVFAI